MEAALASAASITDQRQRIEQYKEHPRVEKIASRMMCEDRMKCSIDQVEAVIHFEDDTEELEQWDQQIVRVCQALNEILDSMAKKGLAVPV